MVQLVLYIPTPKAGLIIGPKGSKLRQLSCMPGISIKFDTRVTNPDGTYTLTITGMSNQAVERAKQEINRIFLETKYSEISSILYCWEGGVYETAEVELELHNGKVTLPLADQSYCNQAYRIKSIRPSVAGLSLDGMDLTPQATFMQGYKDDIVENTFNVALKEEMASTTEFTFSLGEELFNHFGYGPRTVSLPVRNGRVMMKDLKQNNLKGFWSAFLNPGLATRIAKCLEDSGFICLNKDNPETFTKVHLLVWPENIRKHVVLALDKDLNSLAPEADNRLSDDKENAIKQILSAKTLNDVLPAGSSLKISFRKMSLKVHPDKNSHPGATDAFKKLKDAYQSGSRGSELALKITSNPSTSTGKPPKVISVTTNRRKVCTVTMVSENQLNIRAYLKTYDKKEDSSAQLSERIRNVLNNCWENMDAEGGIADPDGRTGVKIELVKQILDRIYYAKEVVFKGNPEILEVCFYKMRTRLHGDTWNECLEIEINFGDSSSSFTGNELAERFQFVKNWWENFDY
ncbi:uncharacterized protein LOC111703703 isoform X2 [Eurytemora carolleeae]|uniref:uncharacterized protein LOC111703703 isoform X2 n=1 Tax=Eurytemora carolleeae TaxID=1294199 RepID=UPI000C794839|nr:uncharacterized protein LOC111703703 isoform X2 [Eurytemora carolleeae]|eukprot:XP_023331500.1 uncharacterized protein LOC111703703 isoform X2 [Eurytemora affinis]